MRFGRILATVLAPLALSMFGMVFVQTVDAQINPSAVTSIAAVAKFQSGSYGALGAVFISSYYAGGNSGGGIFKKKTCTPDLGTCFADSKGVTFARSTWSYLPEDFGAIADATCASDSTNGTDDTAAIQAWMNSNQPHLIGAGCYRVTAPLNCNTGGTINGTLPNGVGASGSGIQPLSNFVPDNTGGLFTGSAVFIMSGKCAINALGILGSKTDSSYDIVWATSPSNGVFNHSFLFGGGNGFLCKNAGTNTEIYDSSMIQNGLVGIRSTCPNDKYMRNIVSSAGLDDIRYSGGQALISQNIIEQAGSNGFNCIGGSQVALDGNYFDNNGKKNAGTRNVEINGCQSISITGNQFQRSSPLDETSGTTTAHIWFDGTNDSISMAGNVYLANNDNFVTAMRPDYDYEITFGAIVTDITCADSPAPQNVGVMGPGITKILAPCLLPHIQPNYISGLTVSNNTGPSLKLDIAAGEASDTSNTTTIQLLSSRAPCTVNLSNNGNNGLDTGTVQNATQYNFFMFVQRAGGSVAKCIASTGSVPNWVAAFPPPAGVNCLTSAPGVATVLVASLNVGDTVASNVDIPNVSNKKLNSMGGIAIGDSVADCLGAIPANTTITSLSDVFVTGFTGTVSSSTAYITSMSSVTGLKVNMQIGGASNIAANSYILAINPAGCTAPCVQMNQNGATSGSGIALNASTLQSITLSNTATINEPNSAQDTIYVYNEGYRKVAALFTDGTPNITQFVQTEDKFDLVTPTLAINDTTLGAVSKTYNLNATTNVVPTGIKVEWWGRCVANAMVHMFATGLAPGAAAAFPNIPGFDTSGTGDPFPERIYTDTSANVEAQASASGTTLRCITDGWLWAR